MHATGRWLCSHPRLTAALGGLCCCIPLVEYLGLGMLTCAMLQRFRASLVIGVAFAAMSALANWYLLHWLLSAWLLPLCLLVLILFARMRNWQWLLLLAGMAGLLVFVLLPVLGFHVHWQLPPAVTERLPLHLTELPLQMPVAAYVVAVILLSALLGRAMQSAGTMPGAFGREMRGLKIELGAWILWPIWLAVAWQTAGVSGLVLGGMPLILPAFTAVSGLPLRGARHVLQWLYLLGCLAAVGAGFLGFFLSAGMLVILPLVLDAVIDWRGRMMFRKPGSEVSVRAK